MSLGPELTDDELSALLNRYHGCYWNESLRVLTPNGVDFFHLTQDQWERYADERAADQKASA